MLAGETFSHGLAHGTSRKPNVVPEESGQPVPPDRDPNDRSGWNAFGVPEWPQILNKTLTAGGMSWRRSGSCPEVRGSATRRPPEAASLTVARQARPDPSHRLEQTSRRTEQGRVARFLAVTGGQCAAETMARSGYLSDAAQVTKRYMDRLAMRVPGPCDIFAWLTRECG
jgi:hypothetical protein